MRRRLRLPAGLALAFVVLHLPFLPASLEDLDSINFALGIRDFDVAQHQPHPPGYPVFIFAAKLLHLLIGSEAAVLSAVGVLAGGLAVFALVALFETLDPRGDTSDWTPLLAATLVVA